MAGGGPNGRVVRADLDHPRSTAGREAIQPAASGFRPPAAADADVDAVRRLYEGREFEEISLRRNAPDDRRPPVGSEADHPAFLPAPRYSPGRASAPPRGPEPSARIAEDPRCRSTTSSSRPARFRCSRSQTANAVWASDRILRLKASDVAVAVAIDGGLLTPVLRDADRKSLSIISNEMKGMAARARNEAEARRISGGTTRRLQPRDDRHRTASAVINPPHAPILAVGAGEERAVVK